MRASELASVAFLVLGVQLLIGIPSAGISAIWMVKTANENPEVFGQFPLELRFLLGFLVLLTLVIGIAFITFRNRLGQAAFPMAQESPVSQVAGTSDLASVALAVAGVWLTVSALRDIAPTVTESFMRSWNPAYGPRDSEPLFVWPQRVAVIFQFVAGVGLFFGSHGLARLWHGLRTAGHSERAV